jgi:hypothetical protein
MRRHRSVLLVPAAVLALVLAACGGGATPSPSAATSDPSVTAAPATPSATASAPTPTDIPGGSDRTPGPEPGTIETSWGTAWETLPDGFPLPPGLTPAEPGDPAEEPSSGAFVVERAVDDVAEQARAALDGAGYSIEALGGPAEDGSLVIDAVGQDPACRIRVTVRPLGGLTLVSVLFGAACPWG